MDHKVDIERTMFADPNKPAQRIRSGIFVLIILSSIALGAFGMASVYHWRELQMFNEQRVKIADVEEAMKFADLLLSKHEASAAHIEKLLALLKHSRPFETHPRVSSEETPVSNFVLNSVLNRIKQKESGESVSSVGNENISTGSKGSPSTEEEGIEHRGNVDPEEKRTEFATLELESENGAPSSELFQWKWTIPRSAWLQLSPFMFNYGVEDASTERSNSASTQ